MVSPTDIFDRTPNFLVILTSGERKTPAYEASVLQPFLDKKLKTPARLLKHGLSFEQHYTASLNICPARTSLLTGQFPSYHGVSRTPGPFCSRFSRDITWLDPNTVPTIADFLRSRGYRTFFRGHWGLGHADIYRPGSNHHVLRSIDPQGRRLEDVESLYRVARRLDGYGYTDWIGHDAVEKEGGPTFDKVTTQRGQEVLEALAKKWRAGERDPWFLTVAYSSPGDIFHAENVDVDLKDLAPLPQPKHSSAGTEHEKARRRYIQRLLEVDAEKMKLLDTLEETPFYRDTVVIVTSDQGAVLGERPGHEPSEPFQESVHVPMYWHSPRFEFKDVRCTQLTSHVDILPTMLGLAGFNQKITAAELSRDHAWVRAPSGRNLSEQVVTGACHDKEASVFFFAAEMIKAEMVLGYIDDQLWKYMLFKPMGEEVGESLPCLFNLTQDPEETNDLLRDPNGPPPAALQELQSRLAAAETRLFVRPT